MDSCKAESWGPLRTRQLLWKECEDSVWFICVQSCSVITGKSLNFAEPQFSIYETSGGRDGLIPTEKQHSNTEVKSMDCEA